jgi:hypothetical protein
MGAKKTDEEYPQDEADRRRDAVLKHMLSRPPQPHAPLRAAKPKTRSLSKGRTRKATSKS